MTHPLQEFFGRIPLFSSLTPDELNELLRAIQPTKLAANDYLFKEGDAGDAAYVIESGEVDVLLERREATIPLATLGPDAVIGEIALLDGQPRTASVRACGDVSLFRIDKTEFDFLRRNLHPAAYKVVRIIAVEVCERLRGTNQLIHKALAESQETDEQEDGQDIEEATKAPSKSRLLKRLAFWRNT